MSKPNLFTFATKELSQDAFICWLLSWASPEHENSDKDLHKCALGMIRAMFNKHDKRLPTQINMIEVCKQDKQIDVLCIINEKYVILIEDKTYSSNHSKQLERYYEDVKSRAFEVENIIPIYYKTEDQADYSKIVEANYQPFLRHDILNELKPYAGSNQILLDYRSHLQSISDQVESYKTYPIKKWNGRSWVGFFGRLAKELGDGGWNYVPNQRGGFIGFWWYGRETLSNCQLYLQLEENKLCFKISVTSKSERAVHRTTWSNALIEESKKSKYQFRLSRPARFGAGETMTVCILDNYIVWGIDNHVDVYETVQRLKEAEVLLDTVRAIDG